MGHVHHPLAVTTQERGPGSQLLHPTVQPDVEKDSLGRHQREREGGAAGGDLVVEGGHVVDHVIAEQPHLLGPARSRVFTLSSTSTMFANAPTCIILSVQASAVNPVPVPKSR